MKEECDMFYCEHLEKLKSERKKHEKEKKELKKKIKKHLDEKIENINNLMGDVRENKIRENRKRELIAGFEGDIEIIVDFYKNVINLIKKGDVE